MFRLTKPVSFEEYTLIIPGISIGNVGQLTNDLLITTYNLTRIGVMWHKFLTPTVGADPYSAELDEICTACELYISETAKLAVIQIRSSIERNGTKDFFDDLRSYILGEKFKHVVILTSAFSYQMRAVGTGLVKYISNNSIAESLQKLDVMPVERNGDYYDVPGSGFALKFYESIAEDVNTTAIIKYTSEGDNYTDAVVLMRVTSRLFGSGGDERICYPASWKFVYGNPPPVDVY